MIPKTFKEWLSCIENDCKVKITQDFVNKRLNVYSNLNHPETKKFVQLYGMDHLKNIIYWLKQASE